MNWKKYEQEIHNEFKRMFPNAEISHNRKVVGRYSKVNRQIDVLIEDYVAGNRMRIIVDGKYFSTKVDVKDVEMFIGMLKDCEAHKGLLITQEGFSQAAINRAYYDSIDIELDILNFKDLHQFQGFVGLPYSGKHGVVLPSPFGWIIDATRRKDVLATLYQRGLSFEQAACSKEFMYVNILRKNSDIKTLEDVLKVQEFSTKEDFPHVQFSYLPTIKRNDAKTTLRLIEYGGETPKEYTGFIEFDEFIFFCVLFTPIELEYKNIRKLENILQSVLPINIKHK